MSSHYQPVMFGEAGKSVSILIQEAQTGSSDAAQEFIARQSPGILRFIDRVMIPALRRLFDPEDFLSDTLMKVLRAKLPDKVLNSPQMLDAYIKRIARNKIHDAERKHVLSQRFGLDHQIALSPFTEKNLPSRELAPTEELVLKEGLERISNLSEKLSKRHRTVVDLLFHGRAIHDIAVSLRISRRTVQRIVRRLHADVCDD